jgi:membrane protein YqaA with SNARE-associated domain
MLRKLYNRLIALAERKEALPWLAAVSFTESSFFPVPPDAMLIPMVLAQRHKAWLFAGVCTIASVAGGLLGYTIGYFLLETVGQWLIKLYGLANGYQEYQDQFAKWGLWIILIKGLTPIPYKLVTIASGAAQFSLPVFIAASVITRGARFFLVAALLRTYGAPIRTFIEKNLTWVTTGFVAAIVGGFLLLKLV